MLLTHVLSTDLNLLVVLHALLETGSVTAAARQLGVTQSSVSRSLARLRDAFGDELFVRRGRGVAPTRFATELAAPLRQRLGELEALLGDRGAFDPATSRRRFRVVAFDYPQVALLAPLARRLARRAPGIDLEIRHPSRANDERLERGEVDLLLAPRHASGAGIVWTPLYSDDYVCVLSADNPTRLTADRFAEMAHVVVAPREEPGAIVDEVLARLRRPPRRVAVQAPTFLVVPHLLAGTPYVATIPARLAAEYGRSHALRTVTPPIKIPGFTIHQGWHELHRHDPGHRWLREEVARVAAEMT
ncbi:MAG: LysR family transcriptional regulator [Deltaproteobacteria bacterium]|nr:LysR family transcriptional regulator [Kofleriaceae bacterium]